MKRVIRKIRDQTFVCTILIDDFHATSANLTKEDLTQECHSQGINLDFIAYESKLTTIADQLIREVPRRLLKMEYLSNTEEEILILENGNARIGLGKHTQHKFRHTCALLSASWLLCRLGAYQIPSRALKRFGSGLFEARKALTILPDKYRKVESKALEIIRSTRFKDNITNIEYHFFKS